jgi:predicted unusual protein kinase regulating ubiquinone biosynthesis (AarF/ABC1/UbiB family)
VGVEIAPDGKPRLVFYDFGQAATLSQDQADGILQIIEAIIDMNVDRSIEAFQKMGVLVDGADLDKVRAKVEENYRTGKVKANRKKLRRSGYKFKDEDDAKSASADEDNREATVPVASTKTNATLSKETKKKDSEVMSFFSLPAEYAFVARAISQMDGVGRGLDPDFDFISNSAPYIVEIKGADKYLKEEAIKLVMEFQGKITKFQTKTLPDLYERRTAELREKNRSTAKV